MVRFIFFLAGQAKKEAGEGRRDGLDMTFEKIDWRGNCKMKWSQRGEIKKKLAVGKWKILVVRCYSLCRTLKCVWKKYTVTGEIMPALGIRNSREYIIYMCVCVLYKTF